MQPRYLFTSWTTNDLTEAKICMVAGKLVALVPKRWEPHVVDVAPVPNDGPPQPQQMNTGAVAGFDDYGAPKMATKEDGSPRNFKVYRVLEWHQIDLAEYLKGAV